MKILVVYHCQDYSKNTFIATINLKIAVPLIGYYSFILTTPCFNCAAFYCSFNYCSLFFHVLSMKELSR